MYERIGIRIVEININFWKESMMKAAIRKINPLIVLSIILCAVLMILVRNYIDEPDQLVCANQVDKAAVAADNAGHRYNAVMVECK
jgi:hypothetical protein